MLRSALLSFMSSLTFRHLSTFHDPGKHRFGRPLPFRDPGPFLRIPQRRHGTSEYSEYSECQAFVEKNEHKVDQITKGCLSAFVLYKDGKNREEWERENGRIDGKRTKMEHTFEQRLEDTLERHDITDYI